ncbi:TetR/AcrR family transcriptional regulator [Nonomuraea sp. NPDC050556]|uniref:TetR/AcrR family transcriptional regulator n=1 Tax=Nonomuraea sp. NPDC050556 TaxID=3364369 RepID=UPI0037B0621C
MMRADAARNREKVLAAAQSVFAEQGVSARTEDVARAAGVGIATVFRHFPTKEALVGAVLVALMKGFVDQADELLAADDPGAALRTFMETLVRVSATKMAYVDALTSAGVDVENALEEGRGMLPEAFGRLLRRAQEAGEVRQDVTVEELIALIVGVSRAPEALRIVFDGIRA